MKQCNYQNREQKKKRCMEEMHLENKASKIKKKPMSHRVEKMM
jgi:hypothetical protein